MITIFCSPKPFIGEAAWNQINALRSWRSISPDAEIIIFGDVEGLDKAAAELNAVIIPEIQTSITGAPSFNAMASYAALSGRYDLQLYVNCDILLNNSILKTMQSASQLFPHFLCVGERLDLAQGAFLDVRQPDWENNLKPLADQGKLVAHGPTGVDYFGFIRDKWKGMPTVFMGRAICDQAILHYCLKNHIPIIDATPVVVAVHQFHDYQHVRGGRQEVFLGDDLAWMKKTHGLNHSLPTIADSGWMFVGKNGVIPKKKRFLRKIELTFQYRYGQHRIALFWRALQYLFDKDSLLSKKRDVGVILDSWHL